MSDDKLHDALARASHARDLLGNEMLAEAFNTLEGAYIKAWRASNSDQADAREKLFIAVNIIGKVRNHLMDAVNNGKLAQRELDDLIATSERKKKFGII